jgi:redox-sensitive bicupin YhaK (pirin superfamily)
MENDPKLIKDRFALNSQWRTQDPFLFCTHHLDHYPPRSAKTLGPDQQLLKNRILGQDFELKDGFRMYHGETVPGFPPHPHRGFETITIVRRGYVDHSDSLGGAGRYGPGDIQWLTAGRGIQHSEMFPLLENQKVNELELFQIWLNLPANKKMSAPNLKMFWRENVPQKEELPGVQMTVIAGQWKTTQAPTPPPDSLASDPNNEVLLLLVTMEPGSSLVLPQSRVDCNRSLYFFKGSSVRIGGENLSIPMGLEINSLQACPLQCGEEPLEFLVLQARALLEPVVQHGPFVMNSKSQILAAFRDYQKNQFGGWPWPSFEMVHGPLPQRFSKDPKGHNEIPSEG